MGQKLSIATVQSVGWPGEFPYTRGPYASMYRSKLWTMRLFAGFGTAEDTNVRFHELLRSGSDGLSVAFDLPTLMGRDSDDPRCEGEVGRCGVAVDTLADVEDLFAGIDLGEVTTSMTINSPAPILLAMYVAAAEKAGVAEQAARRHAPERHPEGVPGAEGVRLPAAPVGAARHRRDRVSARRRCRGSTRCRSPATTSARPDRRPRRSSRSRSPTVSRTSRRRSRRDSTVDEFAPRLSFFFNAHLDFFEEIAKYRAARRIWAPLDDGSVTGRPTRSRCSCGSTPRPPACRSPPSSPR